MDWLIKEIIGAMRNRSQIENLVGRDNTGNSDVQVYHDEAPPIEKLTTETYVILYTHIGGAEPEGEFGTRTVEDAWNVQFSIFAATRSEVMSIYKAIKKLWDEVGLKDDVEHLYMKMQRMSPLRGPEKQDSRLFMGTVDYRIHAQTS